MFNSVQQNRDNKDDYLQNLLGAHIIKDTDDNISFFQ